MAAGAGPLSDLRARRQLPGIPAQHRAEPLRFPAMLQAWLDGAFVPMSDAKISAFDAGFQHGIGLFETMAARHGRIFRGLEHMERMSESARMLGLSDSLRAEALVDAA